MDYQLAIIGAGVSGMVAALLARKSSLSVVLVERQAYAKQHSNAHYLNAYSLDILRQVGVDLDALDETAVSHPQAVTMAYGYSFSELYHVVDLDKDPEYVSLSQQQGPYGACLNIRYDRLVKMLLALVEDAGITVLWEHDFVALSHHPRSIQLRSQAETFDLRVATVLACDGTSSLVRSCVDQDFKPPDVLQTFISFTMHADLRPYVAHDALLYWIYHSACRCCVVAHDLSNYQVVQLPIFPPADVVTDYDVVHLTQLMQQLVGDSRFDPGITDIACWHMSSFVVANMHYDWVYLAGDAAHTMTPAGGLGLNTAIADVFNLIWKLAAYSVHNNQQVVASYQEERHPVACANVQSAYANYQDFVRPAAAAGLDIAYAPWYAAVQQGASRNLMSPLASFVQDVTSMPMRLAYQALQANNPLSYALKKNMVDKIQRNAVHFAGIRQHLGFSYVNSFFIELRSSCEVGAFKVGMRLPYVCCDKDGQCVTTYDRFSCNQWMLLAGSEVKGDFVMTYGRCVVLADNELPAIQRRLAKNWVLVRPDAIVAWCGPDKSLLASLIKKWIY